MLSTMFQAAAELHGTIREVFGRGSFELDFDGWSDRYSRLGCKGRNESKGVKLT